MSNFVLPGQSRYDSVSYSRMYCDGDDSDHVKTFTESGFRI